MLGDEEAGHANADALLKAGVASKLLARVADSPDVAAPALGALRNLLLVEHDDAVEAVLRADAVPPVVGVLCSSTPSASTTPEQAAVLEHGLELLSTLCEASDVVVQRITNDAALGPLLACALASATSPGVPALLTLAAAKFLHVLSEDNASLASKLAGAEDVQAAVAGALGSVDAAAVSAASQAALAAQCHVTAFAAHAGLLPSLPPTAFATGFAALFAGIIPPLPLLAGALEVQGAIEAACLSRDAQPVAAAGEGAAAPAPGTAGASTDEVHKAEGRVGTLRAAWLARLRTARLVLEVTANMLAGEVDPRSAEVLQGLAKTSLPAQLLQCVNTCLGDFKAALEGGGDGAAGSSSPHKPLPPAARAHMQGVLCAAVAALGNAATALAWEGPDSLTAVWGLLLEGVGMAARHVPEAGDALEALLAAAAAVASPTPHRSGAAVAEAQLTALLELWGGCSTWPAAAQASLAVLLSILAQVACSPAVHKAVGQAMVAGLQSEHLSVNVVCLDNLVDMWSGDEPAINAVGAELRLAATMATATAGLQSRLESAGTDVPEALAEQAGEVLENIPGFLTYKGSTLGPA